MRRVRRRDHRIWFVLLGVFVMVFFFTFLRHSRSTNDEVEAASLANFDPGYIISDWQMANYNSMTEAQIQAFLNSKGDCRDTRIYLAEYYPSVSYHIKDGHFVCLAEETFGEGMAYGESAPNGESAAHIIWQTAQDYQINPQVLIVLLQKEQGLITDSWPNNVQYRSATGYGCPDTAPCSSEYYGFKNQVRKAAEMFRTVLNGGWTNYPLGNNYIQYNPDASCGGSVVNVRSLATSALYRYTPYQPNAGALDAGYGYAYCGAYGNRNFYLYFEDWFGGITSSNSSLGSFNGMVKPRLLYIKKGARYIEPETGRVGLRSFASFEFFSHLNYSGNSLCLSIGDKRNCYLYSDLEELSFSEEEPMAIARMMITWRTTRLINYGVGTFGETVEKGEKMIFSKKIYLNGNVCLISNEEGGCILYSDLEELPVTSFKDMVVPRVIYVKESAKEIDVDTGIGYQLNEGKYYFDEVANWFGEVCLKVSGSDNRRCVLYSDLIELAPVVYSDMVVPRFLGVDDGAPIYDAEFKRNSFEKTVGGGVLFFDKILRTQDGLCLRSINEDVTPRGTCIMYDYLFEIDNFTPMAIPRSIDVREGAFYYDLMSNELNSELIESQSEYFVEKIYVGDELCLRSFDDWQNRQYRCVLYSDLAE